MTGRGAIATLAACGFLVFPLARADLTTQEISGDDGLRVLVSSDGRYQITAPDYGWTFEGNIGEPVSDLNTTQGSDANGPWVDIEFDYDPGRSSAIRVYDNSAVVLFSTTYSGPDTNTGAFPHFTNYPQGLSTFSFAPGWGDSFGVLNPHSPWIFFNDQANAFLLSPASNFLTATDRIASDGAMEVAIDSRITSLPAGFTHRAILAFGPGVNSAFNSWGHALTGFSGKQRPANDSVTLLNKLSYWTDAGAAYYYRPTDPTQYVPTLQSLPPAFAHLGIPIASMELDSWYYPKGPNNLWASNSGSGMDTYQADPTLFPRGLPTFEQNLGVPLITHARWIDKSSSIRQHYKMSGNVSIDPQYWQDYANYLVNSNVEVLEQDWLFDAAQTDFNLTDPDAFLDTMAAAMDAAGRKLMYCMPLWGDLMQSSKYNNVFATRLSEDFLGRTHWDEFLFNSPIAAAVGLWPFTDALNSANVKDVLVADLSAGPVASGDAVGSINAANLRLAVRSDGVIVKPDVPLTPLDASFVAAAHNAAAPVVAATHTDQAGIRTSYVLAYDRTPGASAAISFTPESLGMTGPVYVYDFFNAKGSVVNAGSPFTDTVGYSGSYYVVAPIGKSGMAFLGDAGKFVSNGNKRIGSISDDGALHATVSFAPSETAVVLHLYSPVKPYVNAAAGTVSRVLREGPGLYRVTAAPGPNAQAMVTFGVR